MMQNPLPAIQGFLFGPGTDAPSYEALKKRRDIADLLAQQATGSTPKNLGEGIASIGKALASRWVDNKIKPQEDSERQRIASLLSGGSAGYNGSPAPMPQGSGASAIKQGLVARGLPDHVADGIVMNFADESGLNPGINEQNPTVPGSRGGFGLAQWTGPRRDALEQFAQASGKPVGDTNTQLDFLMKELSGPEKEAAQALMSTKDAGSAAAAFAAKFERPAPEHLATRVAKYTGGHVEDFLRNMGQPQVQPDMGRVGQLAEVLGNPYASDGQKAVAQALIQRMLPEQMTPYQQQSLGLDAAKAADEGMLSQQRMAKNAQGGSELFGSPIWGKDAQGNDVLGQLGQDGTFHQVQAPDGVTYNPGGVKVVDQGTQSQVIDRAGAPIGAPLPKDVAGVEAQKVAGTTQGTAAAQVPFAAQALDETMAQVDQVYNNPALEQMLGPIDSRRPDWLQSQSVVDLRKKVAQIAGGAFLQARQQLKGGGAITDFEGQKAEQALARLDQAQSPEEFKAGLDEFKAHMKRGFEALQQQAGGAVAAPAPVGDDDLFSKYGVPK